MASYITNRLFLGGLSTVCTENDVANAIYLLGIYGFTIKLCHGDGTLCKYAFVTFPSVENCQQVHNYFKGGFLVRDRPIHVRYIYPWHQQNEQIVAA